MKDSNTPPPLAAKLLERLRRFRIRRHHVHHVSLATLALLAVGIFFVAGVVLRFAMGPVSLGPFSERLRESLLHTVPGLAVQYEDAALEWSRDEGRVNLIIVGARVLDAQQHIIAQAPKAEIGLAAGALLGGDVQIRRIALVGVQLTLVRTKTGALRLGMNGSETGDDVLERIRKALENSGHGPASLDRFAVRRARLAFLDQNSGLFLVAPSARVEVSNVASTPNSELKADIEADVEITGKPAHLLASMKLPRQGGDITGDVSITGLSLEALSRNSPHFAFLRPFDLTNDLSASIVLEHGNRLKSADLGLRAKGKIGGLGSPLVIKDFDVVGRYDGSTGHFLIDQATLQGNTATAHLQGSGNLKFDQAGSLAAAALDVSADHIIVATPEAFTAPVALGPLHLRGNYNFSDATFTIDQALLSGNVLTGELQGRLLLVANKSPGIALLGKFNPLSVRSLVRYWPLKAGSGARSWIARNMPAGQVGPVSINVNIGAGELDGPALPEAAIHLTIPVKDASVNYLQGMSLATQANGVGVLTGDTFHMDVASARVGSLAVKKASLTIPQLHKQGTVGHIAVGFEGSMPALLKILDEKPLHYPTRFHIDPAQTAGTTLVEAEFHIPMVKDVGIDQVPIHVKADVKGLALSLGEETKLSDGSVVFDIDNKHLRASGSVTYRTARYLVDWVEAFDDKNPNTTQMKVSGTLNEQARDALKIRLGDFISGPLGLSANLQGYRGVIRMAQINVDLTPAAISLGPISYRKEPGTAASAQVSAKLDDKGTISSADLTIGGAGLSAQGTLSFAPDGALRRADIPALRAGPINDFGVTYTQNSGSVADIFIRGRSADGTSLGRRDSNTTAGKKESTDRYHIVAKLDRMQLKQNTVLAPLNAEANMIGGSIQSLSLTTGVSKSASLSANITPASDGRRLSVNANDAGALLKGVLGLSNVSGGRLALVARMPPIGSKGSPDFAGTLEMRDFKVENQPFFARLFSAGSLGGLLDLMRGSGIVINKLELPFTAANDVFNIHDARATGPSVGLSGEGYIDRRANQIDLRGAVAPIYGLNSILGAIPLVGNVLVSRPGEGIVGVTYEAKGNLDEPKINVNPLSLLTPGILRRMFEGKVPSAPRQAETDPPKPQTAPH